MSFTLFCEVVDNTIIRFIYRSKGNMCSIRVLYKMIDDLVTFFIFFFLRKVYMIDFSIFLFDYLT